MPDGELLQTVVLTRLADRHEAPHERRFAETRSASVPAGPLHVVVADALEAGEESTMLVLGCQIRAVLTLPNILGVRLARDYWEVP
jgi:hypothetical protein